MIAAMRLSLPAAEFATWLAAAYCAGAFTWPVLRRLARRHGAHSPTEGLR